MCECELRMEILLIFTLCLTSDGGASREVTGYSGGGVLIKCKYDIKYKESNKYFCKHLSSNCSDQITIGAKNKWVNPGRFSMYDDTESAEFRVMIRELTVQDAGTYQCGVVLIRRKNYTLVELTINEDGSHEKSFSKTVHVGGDLNISCNYPKFHKSNPKFFCKMGLQDEASACSYNAALKESRKQVIIGESTLYEDRAKEIFTVNIRNVTEQDAGEYWCGAEASWESDHGYEVYVTRIILTVTNPRVPLSTWITTQPSSSSSQLSQSTPASPANPRVPVLTRITTQPSSLSSSSSSSSSQLSQSTPSSPPAASTVITVSVILLLLLIGITSLTLTLKKRRTMQGTASNDQCPVQNSWNDQQVPLAVCVYEEIKDNRELSGSDAETSAVCSTVQLPTIPSDPSQPLHDTIVLPLSPCDSVYSTAQLPTIPFDQDIYSTAQLPSGVSAENPAEGLTYAKVSFHSKTTRSSDAVPQFREDVTSDYASARHVTSSV